MSASIRDNIVFSHEYDEIFYNLVLDGKSFLRHRLQLLTAVMCTACALRPDLALMPEGDLTEVGEKGEEHPLLCQHASYSFSS